MIDGLIFDGLPLDLVDSRIAEGGAHVKTQVLRIEVCRGGFHVSRGMVFSPRISIFGEAGSVRIILRTGIRDLLARVAPRFLASPFPQLAACRSSLLFGGLGGR